MLMSRFFPSVLFIFVLGMGGLLFTAQTTNADDKAIDAVGGNSLAKHHIVLQETESDLQRQTWLLNVAGNLLQAYGDNVDIEVVTFDPGIGSLLFANNEQAKHIESLAQQGVRSSAAESQISPDDVAQFIQDRRGGFTPRAVLVQKLNKFGSPSLAVSTFEHEALLTIAGLLNVAPDDQVIVYDDRAPTDAQCFMAPTSKKYVKHTVQPMPSAV
ncbi:MAG: DsrE family protein [Halothiobacillus sp.]